MFKHEHNNFNAETVTLQHHETDTNPEAYEYSKSGDEYCRYLIGSWLIFDCQDKPFQEQPDKRKYKSDENKKT